MGGVYKGGLLWSWALFVLEWSRLVVNFLVNQDKGLW